MFGHYQLGKILGIPLRIHRSLAWFAIGLAVFAGLGSGWTAVVAHLALTAAVFGIVLLHELGHSVAALSIGIRTRDITLYPFGGIARLERMPREPLREILVALAGPAVNFALAGVLALASFVAGPGAIAAVFDPLIWINLGLGIFNLLPGFPMDGGRVLRALLALRMPHARATRLAGKVGRGVAVAMGVAGLVWWMPVLILVAAFVWIAAGAEMGAAALEERAQRSPWFQGVSDPFATVGRRPAASEEGETIRRVLRAGPLFGTVVIQRGPAPGPRRESDVVIDVGPGSQRDPH